MRLLIALLLCGLGLAAQAEENPRVLMETSHGEMTLELYPHKAPKTVENFLGYVEEDFYSGTVFHRVMEDFMIQGGGFDTDYQKKQTGEPITNEADNGLSNQRGTLAMARTGDPHSATAQFFINTVDNPNLDHSGKTPRGWGYAVFGKIVDGLDTLDRIAAVKTTSRGRMANVPMEPVIIQAVSVTAE